MGLRLILLAAALLAAGNASAAGLPPGYAFAPAPAETLGKQVAEGTGLVYTDAKGWYRLTYGADAKAYDDGKSASFAVMTDQGAEVQLNFSRSPFDKPITDLSFDQIQAAQAHQFDPHSDMEKQLAEQTVRDRHIMMLGGGAGKPLRVVVWVIPQPDNSVLWLGVAAGNNGFLVINAAGPNVQAVETYLKAHLQIAEGFVK
jgi:hypothetical protein